jgi:hypothetical protein
VSFRDGSVFADFDVDGADCVFLQRISFDGFGCCDGQFQTMSPEDSRRVLAAVERGAVDEAELEAAFRRYFRANSGKIWSDALASHDLH